MAEQRRGMPGAPEAGEGGRAWWVVLWIIAVSLVVAGSLNPVTRPPGGHHLDKLVHMLAYGGLAALPALLRRMRTALWAALLLLAIGCAVEVLQDYVPRRQGLVSDALADVAGIALGLAAGRYGRSRLPGLREEG